VCAVHIRMLNILLVCVGKAGERFYTDAVAEYAKRLSAFCRFELREIPETRLSANPSQAEINAALADEYKRMKLPERAFICAMCVEGDIISSEELAKRVDKLASGGVSQIAFVVGGSFGLSEELKKRAGLRLSMGRMTFPHALARVMIAEQIYRAFAINAGTKYHK